MILLHGLNKVGCREEGAFCPTKQSPKMAGDCFGQQKTLASQSHVNSSRDFVKAVDFAGKPPGIFFSGGWLAFYWMLIYTPLYPFFW
jgi:hypothetical protein